jgi:hypothetical protein
MTPADILREYTVEDWVAVDGGRTRLCDLDTNAMAAEIARLRRTICVLYREVLHDSEVGDISFVEEVFDAANENGREDPLDIDVVQGVVNMVERLP